MTVSEYRLVLWSNATGTTIHNEPFRGTRADAEANLRSLWCSHVLEPTCTPFADRVADTDARLYVEGVAEPVFEI